MGARERTSIHESGHLIIASALGKGPYLATIIPTAKTLGNVEFVSDDDARSNAAVYLAGHVAETLAFKKSKPDPRDDELAREELLDEFELSEIDDIETEIRAEIRTFLMERKTWRGLELVARRLLWEGTLTEARIRELTPMVARSGCAAKDAGPAGIFLSPAGSALQAAKGLK